VDVAHTHDHPFSCFCGINVVVTCYGIMAEESSEVTEDALELYFCSLKVDPIVKSFYESYTLL
jgi:hypothetical protein